MPKISSRRAAVQNMLHSFQLYAISKNNAGFSIKQFEKDSNLPHNKNRLINVTEIGAAHGKFLVFNFDGMVYLDHYWSNYNDCKLPPDNALLHSGSRRIFLKKTNLLISATEGEILSQWKEYFDTNKDVGLRVQLSTTPVNEEHASKKKRKYKIKTKKTMSKYMLEIPLIVDASMGYIGTLKPYTIDGVLHLIMFTEDTDKAGTTSFEDFYKLGSQQWDKDSKNYILFTNACRYYRDNCNNETWRAVYHKVVEKARQGEEMSKLVKDLLYWDE
jgi:hypothetical protein